MKNQNFFDPKAQARYQKRKTEEELAALGGNSGSQLSSLLSIESPKAKQAKLDSEIEIEDVSETNKEGSKANNASSTTLLQQILNGQGNLISFTGGACRLF